MYNIVHLYSLNFILLSKGYVYHNLSYPTRLQVVSLSICMPRITNAFAAHTKNQAIAMNDGLNKRVQLIKSKQRSSPLQLARPQRPLI